MRTKSRLSLLFLMLMSLQALWLCSVARVRASDPEDIVYLKNGGRARGVVIESDPAKGTRIRLQDGSIRSFDATAVDRVKYGDDVAAAPAPPPPAAPARAAAAPPPPPPPPPAAPAPVPPPPFDPQPQPPAAAPSTFGAGWNAMLGSLRIDSSEPGDIFIEGGEYGPAPIVVQNLSAGPHKVTIRYHAGDDDSRLVHVRGGAETAVSFEGSAGLRAFRAHQGFNFGVGLELGGSLIDDEGGPAINVVARANFAVSRVFEWHADLRLGAMPGQIAKDGGYYTGTYYDEELRGGAAVRVAAQLNLGSIYTVSAGLDLGAIEDSGPFIGGHLSPIGLRMGSERSFLLAFLLGVRSGPDDPPVDFLLGGTYLFH